MHLSILAHEVHNYPSGCMGPIIAIVLKLYQPTQLMPASVRNLTRVAITYEDPRLIELYHRARDFPPEISREEASTALIDLLSFILLPEHLLLPSSFDGDELGLSSLGQKLALFFLKDRAVHGLNHDLLRESIVEFVNDYGGSLLTALVTSRRQLLERSIDLVSKTRR